MVSHPALHLTLPGSYGFLLSDHQNEVGNPFLSGSRRISFSQKGQSYSCSHCPLACLGIIAGQVFAGREKDTLKITMKPMTEQSILGEMLDRMIEQDADMKAEVTQGVGCGTSNIQPGMEKGEFDLYSEYTGTGWNMVMKKDGRYSEDLFKDMQKEYKEKLFGIISDQDMAQMNYAV